MSRLTAFITRYLFGALSCLYLFTLGVLREKNRLLISSICAHFGYREKAPVPVLPKVGVATLVPEDLPIQVREPVEADGNISLVEIAVISKLIKSRDPAAVFEIGTFDGRTTLNMAANSPADARIFTLDLPRQATTELPIDPGEEKYIDKEVSGTRFIGTDCERKITQLYGDSATFDFAPYHNTIDVIFVDGAHSYEYVLHDSHAALKLLKNGKGLILWHDYDKIWWPGLTRALNELYAEQREFSGVKHIDGTSLVCLIL
ncbi:MAG: class I SAM-dependent methyltransferase [Candidatus Poribacteria bacterium]|nr:class I SAM-dependent methyltransferase [Candidatus Poribacteria bacterium]